MATPRSSRSSARARSGVAVRNSQVRGDGGARAAGRGPGVRPVGRPPGQPVPLPRSRRTHTARPRTARPARRCLPRPSRTSALGNEGPLSRVASYVPPTCRDDPPPTRRAARPSPNRHYMRRDALSFPRSSPPGRCSLRRPGRSGCRSTQGGPRRCGRFGAFINPYHRDPDRPTMPSLHAQYARAYGRQFRRVLRQGEAGMSAVRGRRDANGEPHGVTPPTGWTASGPRHF